MALPENLRRPGRVSFAEVRRSVEGDNLGERASVLHFAQAHPERIRPIPEKEWYRDELYRYYVDCVRLDPDPSVDEDLHSRYEAARGLIGLFEWLVRGHAGGTKAAAKMAASITELFRRSGSNIRDCIEMGFLEHVLEVPEIRPYFSHWSRDADLAESHQAALAWGEAHERSLNP